MLDKGRISSVQFILLLFMMTSVTSFLFVSSIVAKSAGPDSWLSVSIVGPVFGLAVALVAITLAQRFPFQVITEYLSAAIGPIPGKAVALAYPADRRDRKKDGRSRKQE